jgi:hypothetical protein
MASPFQNLNINWDFALDSKKSYFNSPISLSGVGCISFCDTLTPFYEISSVSGAEIFISEALENKAIFLDGVTKPFVYLKNIGDYDLNVCSASSDCSGSYFDYSSEKVNKKFNCSYSNYKIGPKQGLLLNLNSSQDGSYYFSSGEYPFGFFYNFDNIKENNPLGEYPIYEISGNPIYRYEDLRNFNLDYLDRGCYCLSVENNGSYRVYDSPSNCNNFTSALFKDEKYIQVTGANTNVSNGYFNFSTWFKLNCIANNTGATSIAYVDSEVPFSLFGFKCDRIFAGSGDSYFYDLCYDTCTIFFDGINNISAGIYTDNCSGAYLPSNEFTIEFFSKNDCLAGSSFLKFDGIELNLGGGFAPLILGNCHHTWNTGCYVKTGEWQHFAITRTDECIRVYVDYCCVFGVCNTCCFTISNNSPNYIGCGLVGCIHSFRYLKNQSLYYTDCIPRILPPLSCSGFVNCNQGITGNILFLGLQSCELDIGWNHINDNQYVFANLICENYECGFFIKTGVIQNQWNHFVVNVNNCIGSIYLNGEFKCLFCGFGNSGINLSTITGGNLIIGNNSNCFNNFNGLLAYAQYSNPNNYFVCSVLNFSGFDCGGYPDFLIDGCAASLALDFAWACQPFESYKTYSFSSLIDNNLNLNISFSGSNKTALTSIQNKSFFGQNSFEYSVNTKCIHLYCNDKFLCFIYPQELNFYSGIFSETINSAVNICLLYDIDYSSEKKYRYKYKYSGTNGDSCQNIILSNNISPCCIVEFSGTTLIEPDVEYEFSGNANDKFYIKYNLSPDYSLSKIVNKEINNQCLLLPIFENLPYDYCYEMANLNYSYENNLCGSFVNTGFIFCNNEFLNNSSLTSCLDQFYIDNEPINYYLCLNYSENRFSTTSFLCKNETSTSEDFIPIFSSFQESYFYSGIEFKYYPVECIVYKDLIYEIPQSCINITLQTPLNSTTLDFPIQALSLDKLKIISNSEVYEKICSAKICLDYNEFKFNFEKNNSNLFCFNIPKIKNFSLDCFQSPIVNISFNYASLLDDCVSLYLNPYSNFNSDRFYGLNNLLFFIANELNSGSIHQCQYSGYSYNSDDYNFLMIDLENEFYDCNYCMPSGSGNFLINQKITSRQASISEPFSYKSKSGDGYSYVFAIPNCFCYSDSFNHSECGAYCSEIFLNKNLNFINTGFKYVGGSCETYDVYCNNIYSGSEIGFVKNSLLNIFQNNLNITIDSSSISQTETGRILNFSKNYVFSGVQPVKFITNYPLSEIRDPIYCTDLTSYSSLNNESGLNNFYYIVYNLTNFQNKAIKFISPDCTFISSISWADERGDRSVFITDACNADGKIQNNAGYIKYEIANLINSNCYYLNFNSLHCINIEINGGIL